MDTVIPPIFGAVGIIWLAVYLLYNGTRSRTRAEIERDLLFTAKRGG